MSYVDPNSGRAPQPGGRVRGEHPTMAVQDEAPEGEAPEPEPEPEDEPEPEPEPEDEDDLESHNRDQLIEIAGELDITGRHQMTRQELLDSIRAAR